MNPIEFKNAMPPDLTLELRFADGSSTEFYQDDRKRVATTLRLLANPRILTQPQLVLASELGVSMIACPRIDLMLARRSPGVAAAFPLKFPTGLLDIAEVREESPVDLSVRGEEPPDSHAAAPFAWKVHMHTLGGWMIALKVMAAVRKNIYDERQSFAHFFDLPVLPFRLMNGGIGLINPNNITRVNAYPGPDVLPDTALPMHHLRSTPPHFKTAAARAGEFTHESEP